MKKQLVVIFLLITLVLTGCTSPKGAVPYAVSGGEEKYIPVQSEQNRTGIILGQWYF